MIEKTNSSQIEGNQKGLKVQDSEPFTTLTSNEKTIYYTMVNVFPLGCGPMDVSIETGLKYDTVKTTMRRMSRPPKNLINRVDRGIYKPKITSAQIEERLSRSLLGYHGIKAIVEIKMIVIEQGKKIQKGVVPTALEPFKSRFDGKVDTKNKRTVYKDEFLGRTVTTQAYHDCSKLLITLQSDKNQLTDQELDFFSEWLSAKFSTFWKSSEAWLTGIGIARDSPYLELDGVKKISIKFGNITRQLYQKFPDIVRDDYHMEWKPGLIGLEEGVAYLTKSSMSYNWEKDLIDRERKLDEEKRLMDEQNLKLHESMQRIEEFQKRQEVLMEKFEKAIEPNFQSANDLYNRLQQKNGEVGIGYR